jgi:uncharacterized repeat protein (TIGR01451 family)
MIKSSIRLIAVFICLFQFSLGVHAQNWAWSRREADKLDVYLNSNDLYTINNEKIAVDQFGNIVTYAIVRTKRMPGGTDSLRLRINKTDRYGNLIWQKYAANVSKMYDMKMDRFGNTYAAVSNFIVYDNRSIPLGSTSRCFMKVDANGKLVWKKPLSTPDCDVCADGRFTLTINPSNDNMYVIANASAASYSFCDSVYNEAQDNSRLRFFRIDTSGHVLYSQKITGAYIQQRYPLSLSVTANDQVQFTIPFNAGSFAINWADTTISGSNGSSVIAWVNGLTEKRIKVKTVINTSNPDWMDISFGQQMPNGESVFWVSLSRGSTGANFPMTFADSSINPFLSNTYDNPFIAILDANGKLKHFNPLGSDRILAYSFTSDGSNYYLGGTKSNGSTFIPFVYKITPAGTIAWTMTSTNTNSNNAASRVNALQWRNDQLTLTTRLDYANYPIFGNDTIPLPGFTLAGYSVLSSTGGQFNLIKGQVYYDINKNGVKESNEPGLQNILIGDSAKNVFEVTGFDGRYTFITDTGSFNLKIPFKPRYTNWNPQSIPINFGNNYGLLYPGMNFRLTFDTIVRDMSIYGNYTTPVRPGFEADISVWYRNNGNVPTTGTCSIKLDPAFEFLSSDSTIVFSTPDSLVWNYTNIQPFETRRNRIKLKVKATTPINQLVQTKAYIYPIVTDSIPSNNIDSFAILTRGSYDPNDKLSNPVSEMLYEKTVDGSQVINYTIRFQNTGTDTAFTVRIIDSISSKLNLGSLELLGSSHLVQLNFTGKRKLEFLFPNIFLPDSNTNEKLSHGFVRFRIKPMNTVLRTDTIYNGAGIYFDYNAPVITNTTKNYFAPDVSTGVSIITLESRLLKLFPNPTSSVLNYQLSNSPRDVLMLRIYDIAGRVMYVTNIAGNGSTLTGTINSLLFSKGVYILEIQGKSNKYIKRFVIE